MRCLINSSQDILSLRVLGEKGKVGEEVHLYSKEGCVGILSPQRGQLGSWEKIRSPKGIMGRGSRAEGRGYTLVKIKV